jgi:hypothetical protein
MHVRERYLSGFARSQKITCALAHFCRRVMKFSEI